MKISNTLEEGCFYHIYNRGNNSEILFKEDGNYFYFLKLMRKYILPVADVYTYCLLNNHFHILIRIKENVLHANEINQKTAEQMFSNLFNSYAKAFNKKYGRTGKLFEERFKKKKVKDEFYLTELIYYIHANPQNHGFLADFRTYRYSSYLSLISDKATDLKRPEVWDWFGGKKYFEKYHADKHHQLNDTEEFGAF
ncbi:transposase [Pedobacter petrophilus]|uniref:Transposase n=1 Tax=Pedobacter petrophilus TaxID=1908241 RepID=A0A7K0FSK1_9SPHI|nr:transposase [Pedobacter petrophilus]MRX74585.1 transposase [Pedobacter petrophilus]